MKRFIFKNLPVSSRLHNLCKHYRAWCFPYNRVNGCSWNVLSISFTKRRCHKNGFTTIKFKSELNSGTLSPQSSYLRGGMEPHSLSTNLASVSRLTARLAAIGLRPFDVGGQGNCFFKSVSHQIYGDAAMHINIRMAGIRYLIDHPEIFIHSLANETWESYINRMSTPGTWCDNLIIQAVANALNCVIHIVSSEICSQSQSIIITPLLEDTRDNYITIGYLSGLHYVSTKPLAESNNQIQQYRNKLYVANHRLLETANAKKDRLEKAQEYKRQTCIRSTSSNKNVSRTNKRSCDTECPEQTELKRSKTANTEQQTIVEKHTTCNQFISLESSQEIEHVKSTKEKGTQQQTTFQKDTASNQVTCNPSNINKQPGIRQSTNCFTNSNLNQSHYLSNFNISANGCLHEQPWAKHNIKKFHKSLEFTMTQCTVCKERWPLKTTPKNSSKYVCLRCSRDKAFPKKFSCENNMIPSKVPAELQEQTQIEEMLIARALPIMRVYIKPGGQRGYSGHCRKKLKNWPPNCQDFLKIYLSLLSE